MSKQAKNHELVQIRPTTSWQTKFLKMIKYMDSESGQSWDSTLAVSVVVQMQ